MTWRTSAACVGQEDLFFIAPGNWRVTQAAKAICEACPVLEPCRDYAVDSHQRFGVWGGLTPRERRRLKAEQRWGSKYEKALAREGTWVSTSSIAAAFSVSYQSAYQSLRVLANAGRVERRERGEQLEWRVAS